MRILHLLAPLVLLMGCATSAPIYDIMMENATDFVIQVYEDDAIAIRFTPGRDHLAFDLQNKTNGVVEVLWDDIRLKDVEGHPHEVLRMGVPFADKGKPQEPTLVPPRRRVQESMIPKDHIVQSGDPGEWEVSPILLPAGMQMKETKSLSATVIGKNFSVIMPLKVWGKKTSYFFNFKVTGISSPGGKAPLQQHGEVEKVTPIK